MKVDEKTYVAIDYVLTLDDGKEVDRSRKGIPLGFITGTGQIIPALEKKLTGMSAGESTRVTLEPEEGYGPVRADLFQNIPLSQFPEGHEVQPGMSFEAQGPRGPLMIVVKSINDDDTVTVDLNHPMAGKRLHFELTVVEVREPSAAELANAASSCGCGCGTAGEAECGPGCDCG